MKRREFITGVFYAAMATLLPIKESGLESEGAVKNESPIIRQPNGLMIPMRIPPTPTYKSHLPIIRNK